MASSGDQVVTAELGWASKELMDLIEAVPYHLDRICCNCFSLHFGSLLFCLACLDHVYIGVVVVNYIHWIVFIFSDQ